MIKSYTEIPVHSMNAMTEGIWKVRYIGNSIYRCFGVELEIPFGECPEVHFENYFAKK